MARRKKRKAAGSATSQPPPKPPKPSSNKKKVIYDPDEDSSRDPQLTMREEEVRFWAVRGKDNSEIAAILGARPGTVRKHVEHIRGKVHVETRLALIAAYWQQEVDKRDQIIADLKWRLGEAP